MGRSRALLTGLLMLAVVSIWAILASFEEQPSPIKAGAGAHQDPATVLTEEPQAEPTPAAPTAPVALTPPALAERALAVEPTTTLSVQVLDVDTGQPLAGVPLSLLSAADQTRFELTSTADGRVRFEQLALADYTLQADAAGDLDYRAEPLLIELEEKVPDEVVLSVERRWFLAGTVVEAGSLRPVPELGLKVQSDPGRTAFLATSDQDGRFRGEQSFPAGTLGLFHSNRETRGLSRGRDDGPELLRVQVDGSDVSDLRVEVDWNGVLRGLVVDQLSRPVAAAEVRALNADSIFLRSPGLRYWALSPDERSSGRVTHTDEQGRFSLRRLPNDRALVLIASADGHAASRSPVLTQPFEQSGPLVELHLLPGGSIFGRVLDTDDRPLQGLRITGLSRNVEHQPDPCRTNELGEYRLDGLAPGETEVTARARGEAGHRHVVASGRVLVTAGEELELVLRAGADGLHLKGVAVDQHGRVITAERMRLRLRSRPLEPWPGENVYGMDAPLQADGSFDVTVTRSGGYRLTLLSSIAGELWESQEVQAPADDLRLTFTIVPSSLLTVRAVDAASNEPIQEGDLSISWGRGSRGMDFTGGVASSQISEGRYTLSVDAKGYAPANRQLDLRGEVQPTTDVTLRLERGRQISGIVQDSAGRPVKGCTVVMRVERALLLRNLVYSDAEGRFTLNCAPASGGSVCVIDEQYRTLARTAIGPGEIVLKLEGGQAAAPQATEVKSGQ